MKQRCLLAFSLALNLVFLGFLGAGQRAASEPHHLGVMDRAISEATRGQLVDASIEQQVGPRFALRTNIYYKKLKNFGDSAIEYEIRSFTLCVNLPEPTRSRVRRP